VGIFKKGKKPFQNGGSKMIRSVKDLHGYAIQATDGEIGEVYEFYFDDETWTVRYLVVETGTWLSGRRVMIAPAVLGEPDTEEERLPVSLTREQIKNSPQIDIEQPISIQKERELNEYYGWPSYWAGTNPWDYNPALQGSFEVTQLVMEEEQEKTPEPTEPLLNHHLRSSRQVIGYHIQASDGPLGHVQDFLVDDETWAIRYVVVDTRNWWPGKVVLVAPQWIRQVDWEREKVHVDLNRDSIKSGPEFDNLTTINRDYENKLYDHYKRRKYWS
jgi:sporulation protein YlmC with PRC-barrel domain